MFRAQLFTALFLLASSCATRSVPVEIALGAPSSPKAGEAPLRTVTLALEQDPPYGATTTATASPHQHHGGHHHGH